MKKLIGSLFTLALLGVMSAASATGYTKPPPVPVINWVPCGVGTAVCGMAQVPLDYDDPQGATTSIALAKIPAANPSARIGTVFVNFGGPGISGVNRILSPFGPALAFVLQGRFDVVGFDPRGVGFSAPLQCFDTMEARAAYLSPLPVFPYRWDQQWPFFQTTKALAPICFGRGQSITAHMSTADVVRDLDLLRQAVGDQGLTYLGFSYGSYIGNTYANLYPSKVRAVAIDGVLDPRLWSSGLQITSDRVAMLPVFQEFLRLCDEAGAICALSGPEGAAARYAGLADALKGSPLVFPDGSVYSYDVLVADTVAAMYVPEFWSQYAQAFNFLANAVRGDRDAVGEAASERQAIADRLSAVDPPRATYNNQFEAYFGNQCADTQYPFLFPSYVAIASWAEKGSFFGPYWWWYNTPCAAWPLSSDRYAGPWTARTRAPVLVVGNYFDGVTDYDGAVATSKLLKNSRLLSYAGWGHTAFQRSSCVMAYTAGYLLEGALPPEGTVCPANPNPFLPSMLRRATEWDEPMIGLPPTRPGR